ncbi:MAG: RluA family pseudouridine synthase [Treponema sp.]|nr:RluA family pseudouridine synthase [Treponema sp.]
MRTACCLDVFLRTMLLPQLVHFGAVSNSKLRRLIISGSVCVNGTLLRYPSYALHPGSTVSVMLDRDRFFFEKRPDDIAFELESRAVLYEDDFLIVVNKPPFFPTEGTVVAGRDNMHAAVVRYLQRMSGPSRNSPYCGIMHRLDRETSGVLLFTKQRSVNAAVHEMFEKHTTEKIYRAVCTSKNVPPFPDEFFDVENFIGRISPQSSAAKWGPLPEPRGGVYAHTIFRNLGPGMVPSYHADEKKGGNASLFLKQGSGRSTDGIPVYFMEVKLLTGRTHQIRVHSSSAGFSLLGDTLYGGLPYTRVMLHAAVLTFTHPVTGLRISVEAPLPELFYQ